ncbi:MAG: VTT domain-containing protein [Planctomycetes bacterium]|nr:VTT domain-containing protein [Planctomycetota bacterium]
MSLDSIHNYIHEYGYLAVAVGTMIDQSGVAAFVVAGGAYAAATGNLDPTGVVIAGAIGSFSSDMLLYWIGRWRAAWLERWVKTDKNRMRMQVLRDGMFHWAMPLIALGRFLPWIGRFVPAAAGLQRYKLGRTMLWSALGSILCGILYTAVGYFGAESFSWLEGYAVFLWVGALLLSFPVSAWVMRRFDKIVDMRLKTQEASDDE